MSMDMSDKRLKEKCLATVVANILIGLACGMLAKEVRDNKKKGGKAHPLVSDKTVESALTLAKYGVKALFEDKAEEIDIDNVELIREDLLNIFPLIADSTHEMYMTSSIHFIRNVFPENINEMRRGMEEYNAAMAAESMPSKTIH